MKIKSVHKLFGLLSVLMIITSGWANAQKIRSERKITESFTVNANTTLTINNKFGKVNISTNPGNKINVVVTVVGKGTTAEQAKNIANGFPVKIGRGDNIIFKSDEKPKMNIIPFGQDKNKIKIKNQKTDYEINYEVSMPQNVPLTLNHSFGEVFLGNHDSRLKLNLSHGHLKAQQISGNEFKHINVKFGSADIAYVERGRVDVSHSDLSLAGAGTIEFHGKNGNINLGKINNIKGDVSYSVFNIDLLNKTFDMTTRYNSTVNVKQVSANFTKINLATNYNGAEFNFSDSDSFDFEVDVSFGAFKYDSGKVKLSKQVRGSTKASYAGKYNNGSSTAKVTVKGNYGGVTFE